MWRIFALLISYSLYSSILAPIVVVGKSQKQQKFAFIETMDMENNLLPGFEERFLSHILGLTMVSSGAPGQLTYPRIQGAIREQSPITWNGLPIATEDSSLLPLSTGEVQIKKGVHCAELGNAVIGGALNIIPFQKPDNLNGEVALSLGNYHYLNKNLWWQKKSKGLSFQQHLHSVGIKPANPVVKRYRNQYSMQRSAFAGKKQFLNNLKAHNTHGQASLQVGMLSLNTLDANKRYSPCDYRTKQHLQIYGFDWQADETLKVQPYLNTLYTKRISKFFSLHQQSSFSKITTDNVAIRSGIILKKNNWTFQPGFESHYQSLEQYAFLTKQKRYSRAAIALVQGVHFEKGNLQSKNWVRMQKPEHTQAAHALSSSWLLNLNKTSISTHLGSGFRLPSLYERFSHEYGNANLKSEKAIGANAGISHVFAFGKLGILFFRTQSKQMITFINNKYVNHKLAVQKGIETSYEKKFGFKFLKASFTYTEAAYKKPFEKMQNIPRKGFAVQFGYDNAITFAEFGIRYTGSQIQPDYVDYQKIVVKGGYMLASISCSHLITDNIKLNGSIENILNRTIESVPGYPQPKLQAILGVKIQW